MISAFLGSPQKGKIFLTKSQWEHETVIRFTAVRSILNEAVPHKQNKIAEAMFCLRICAHLNYYSARLSQIIKFNLKFQWPNFIEQNSTTAAIKQTAADLLNVDDGKCYSCYQRCLWDFFSEFIHSSSCCLNSAKVEITVDSGRLENWSFPTEPMLGKFTKGKFEFL